MICERSEKRAYHTRKKAMLAIARQHRPNGVPLYCYCCWGCGKWHLTSQVPRAERVSA
jgi:hypothetical protein